MVARPCHVDVLGLHVSMLAPNRVIAKDVKSCVYCCYVRYATLIVRLGGGMPWLKKQAQLITMHS